MAIVEIPGGVFVPTPLFTQGSVPAFTALTSLTNTSEYVSWIFQAPKDGTLDTVGFRTGNVTSAQDLNVSFRAMAGTGLPAGTIDQFYVVPLASVASFTWTITGSLTDTGSGGGVKRTVTAGDYFAVVVRLATTSGAVGMQIVGMDELYSFPYYVYSGSFISWCNSVSVTYDDGSYAAFQGAVYPWSAFSSTAITTATTPDELGNLFTPTAAMELSGAYAKLSVGSTCKFVLYDSDGTSVLAQTATTVAAAKGDGTTSYTYAYPFVGGPVTLTAGLTYRLVVQPTSASSVTLYAYDVTPAAAMGAVELGTSYYATERTDAGAWTDTDTRRYMLGFRLSGIDSGGSSGGSGGSFTFLG